MSPGPGAAHKCRARPAALSLHISTVRRLFTHVATGLMSVCPHGPGTASAHGLSCSIPSGRHGPEIRCMLSATVRHTSATNQRSRRWPPPGTASRWAPGQGGHLPSPATQSLRQPHSQEKRGSHAGREAGRQRRTGQAMEAQVWGADRYPHLCGVTPAAAPSRQLPRQPLGRAALECPRSCCPSSLGCPVWLSNPSPPGSRKCAL